MVVGARTGSCSAFCVPADPTAVTADALVQWFEISPWQPFLTSCTPFPCPMLCDWVGTRLVMWVPSVRLGYFSNGNAVQAKRVESTCTSTATSASADACSWRQWWIEPSATGAVDYYAYDEADHPVDIAPGTLWYT